MLPSTLTVLNLSLGTRQDTRQSIDFTSRRWAGRTASRRLRQQQWTPPDLGRRPQRSLSTYSDEGYILGDSTPSTLKQIAGLFRNGTIQRKHAKERLTEHITYSPSIIPSEASELDSMDVLEISDPRAYPPSFELDAEPRTALPAEERPDSAAQERTTLISRIQADDWLQVRRYELGDSSTP